MSAPKPCPKCHGQDDDCESLNWGSAAARAAAIAQLPKGAKT